jgi:DNA polymerase III delta prime subunit
VRPAEARGVSARAILGHEAVRRSLAAARAADRLPHALLFSGPEGVGKRTVALELARELVVGDDPEGNERFDRGAHERFLVYADLEKPLPVRRADLLGEDLDEAGLIETYAALETNGWITGVSPASGPEVIDLLHRNPEKFVGRRGIPFADVLEKELTGLEKARKVPAAAREVARRLFTVGTSSAPYRRNLGIELINGKGDGAHFRTVDSLLGTATDGWRVVILDDAHRMTDAAENAFLKTLEEPPPRTLLVLVTSEPLSLLATTVSRCARIVFDGVPPADLARFLGETQGASPSEARLVAGLAEGSVGRALELLALDFAEHRAQLEKLLGAIADGDLRRALAFAGRRFAPPRASAGSGAPRERSRDRERREARLLLDLLALGLRDVVLAGAAPDVAPASGLAPDVVRRLAARRDAAVWEDLFDRAGVALADVEANVEPRLAVEALLAEAVPPAAEAVPR